LILNRIIKDQATSKDEDRLKKINYSMMITSFCLSWINFCEKYYPDLISKLLITKSPTHCLRAMIETYCTEKENIGPVLIKHISIMPCTSKKFEIHK